MGFGDFLDPFWGSGEGICFPAARWGGEGRQMVEELVKRHES